MIKTSELILLYLYDHIDEQLAGECSILFSRPGMQENLGLSKSSLSENISSLTKEGLIEERRKYVAGTGRYRNFYFLTQEGIVKAGELQEEIGEKKIKVREREELKELKVSKLVEYLKKITKKPGEEGYTYLVKGEKTDKAYEVFKELLEKGCNGIIISDVSPKKIEKNYRIKEQIYWLSEIEGENVLKPDRLDFETMSTISNFLKENEKPVIMLEGFEYLSEINGFDTCMKWIKTVVDVVAKNNGILILPINPAVFSEKEFSLLSQTTVVYEPREIPPVEINYTNILKNITPEGYLDIRTILEPKRYVDYSERRPEIKYFFGREKELNEIRGFMKSKSKILCVKGISGVGKTTLLTKFLEGIEMNIFWYRFTEFSTLRAMITKISDFLLKIDRKKLENYLKGERFDVEEILVLLQEELKGSNALLVFDDFQKACKEIVDFFRAFKDLETDVKIIMLGRAIPPFYDRRYIVIKKNIRETVLGGLDKESSIKLLRCRKIEKELDRLYSITRGHPLLLELITPETKAEAEEYIKEEIIRRLEDKERRALEIASVFRHPFPAIAIVNGTDYDTIDALVSKSLMQRSSEVYVLHDLIKDHVFGRLSDSKRKEYYLHAGEYYTSLEHPHAILEAIFCFVESEERERAAKLAIKFGEKIIDGKYLEEFYPLLGEVEQILDQEDLVRLYSLKADVLGIWGRFDDSIKYYDRCIEFVNYIRDKNLLADVYYYKSSVLRYRREVRESLKFSEKALKIYQEQEHRLGIGKSYAIMSVAYENLGELEKSDECFNRADQIATELGSSNLKLELEMLRGWTHFQRGNYSKAVDCFEKIFPLLKSTKQRILGMPPIKMYITIRRYCGYAYLCLGKDAKAEEYTKEVLEYCEKVGDLREKGRALYNMGGIYQSKNVKFARKFYEEALQIASDTGDLQVKALVLAGIGDSHKRTGNADDALNFYKESLKLLEKIEQKHNVEAVTRKIKALRKEVK